ncbi:MAG TPA: hypothetical protein VNJ04_03550 [Gemmatimonadaceae bacterium]|nr:hypothetical protein [Gemmatimonadaceae bacterium]
MAVIASLVVKLSADVSELKQNMEKAEKTIATTAKAFAAAWVVTEILQAAKATLNFAGSLTDMSARTGVGTSALQELKFGAEEVGVSFDTVTASMSKLQNTLASGDKTSVNAFRDLGLSAKELRAVAPEQQLQMIGAQLALVGDSADRTRIAYDVFGKSAADMMPLLLSDFDAFKHKAHELGIILSGNTIKNLNDLGDSIDRAGLISQSVIGNALGPLAQALNTVAGAAGKAQGGFTEWMKLGTDALQMLGGEITTVIGVATRLDGLTEFGDKWAAAAVNAGGAMDALATQLQEHESWIARIIGKQTQWSEANQKRVDAAIKAEEALQKAWEDTENAKFARSEALERRLFGNEAVQEANRYLNVIGEVARVSGMTAEAQAEVNRVITAGYDAWKAQGGVLTETTARYRELITATTDWAKVTATIAAMVDDTPVAKTRMRLIPLNDSADNLIEMAKMQQRMKAIADTIAAGQQAIDAASASAAEPLATRFEDSFSRIEQGAVQMSNTVESILGAMTQTQAYADAGFIISNGFGTAARMNRNAADAKGMTIPGFATGTDGYQNFGAGTPVMLHGWEKVTPKGSGGGDGTIINVHVNAPVANPAQAGREIANAIVAAQRAKGRRV